MERSETTSDVEADEKHLRGRGRGSSFFVLRQSVWDQLCSVRTVSRMNLITTYLVLLAGTGSDHQLTKWSAKACEEHAGLGKPRAKQAIDELIQHGMIERSQSSTRLSPQYRLPPVPSDEDPIYLPVQLVTGLDGETPMLRRVRETGDEKALEMMIDLYGLIQLDATYGVPIENLREEVSGDVFAHKLCEVGVHALWALPTGNSQSASGDWAGKHRVKAKTNVEAWKPFWDRIRLLKKIGALLFEPWIFDGADLLAEPLMPVDPGVIYGMASDGDEVTELTRLLHQAASTLARDREYLLERYPNAILLPLTLHRQAPAIRGVAKMRVEADTPGRRMTYAKRMDLIERNTVAVKQLITDAASDRFDRPMRLTSTREAG